MQTRKDKITTRTLRARGWVTAVGIEDKCGDTVGEWAREVAGLPPRQGLGTWPAVSLV